MEAGVSEQCLGGGPGLLKCFATVPISMFVRWERVYHVELGVSNTDDCPGSINRSAGGMMPTWPSPQLWTQPWHRPLMRRINSSHYRCICGKRVLVVTTDVWLPTKLSKNRQPMQQRHHTCRHMTTTLRAATFTFPCIQAIRLFRSAVIAGTNSYDT